MYASREYVASSNHISIEFHESQECYRRSLVNQPHKNATILGVKCIGILEKYPSMKDFVAVVRDGDKGRNYRRYAGIRHPHLPCEGTFTNLKERLGENLYNHILHVLVDIAEHLGFLSYQIIATDGTLFPSNSRYKGCTYFCHDCQFIEFKGIIENVRKRIIYRLNDPRRLIPGKDIRIKVPCPSKRFPDDLPRPKVDILTLCLQEANLDKPSILNQIFVLKDELQKAGLDLMVKRGVLTKIVLDGDTASDSFFFRCPKLPSDMDARIGVRRNPQNPNRKQKIFGFNAIIDTSIELELGLELPVACTTIAGNAEEGRHFVTNRKQVLHHHRKTSKIDLADAKYDELNNYAFSRSQGAIPIIDYNPRNENISITILKDRGHDRNGWPFAPCGLLTRPNGFDFNSQRASFSCRRQCVTSKDPAIVQYARDCLYWINYYGFTKHMSIKQFPRLITEVIRGTERHHKLKALRSASERTNASAKDDFCILAKPKVRGLRNAGVISQMAVIVVLLKRITRFIVKVTLVLRNQIENNKSQHYSILVPGPKAPKFILNLVQRE
jgi:hypothetical protein